MQDKSPCPSLFSRFLAAFVLCVGAFSTVLSLPRIARAQCDGPPIWVADRDCSVDPCSPPPVDGAREADAYADGLTIPLQRFTDAKRADGTPLPDGSFSTVLDGDTLHMQFEVEGDPSNCDPANSASPIAHRFDILLDLDPTCGPVSDTSRRFTFRFETTSKPNDPVVSFNQFIGDQGSWGAQLGPNDGRRFPVSHSVVPIYQNNGQDVRRFRVEVAITLKTENARQAGQPSVIRSGDNFQLGLGFNDQDDQCAVGFDALYPRRTAGIGDFFTDGTQWARVSLEVPQTRVELMSYNVGQGPMPIAVDIEALKTAGVIASVAPTVAPNLLPFLIKDGDGGTGEPMELGFVASHVSHTCMQEAWFTNERNDIIEATNMALAIRGFPEVSVVGYPEDKDAFEDIASGVSFNPELLLEGEVILSSLVTLTGGIGSSSGFADPLTTMVQGGVAVGVFGDTFGAGANGEDNGLLLMSRGVVTRERVHQFPDDVCSAEDCFENKGFNYARVRPALTDATEGSEFVDLFCTHMQNTGTSDIIGAISLTDMENAHEARDEQLERLKASIDDLAASDRRAILVGDFNFDGNHEETYETLRDTLGLRQLASFEEHNNFLSDRYDLGVRNGDTTVDQDINQFFMGSKPHFTGFSTSLGRGSGPCHEVEKAADRVDYVMVLPSRSERQNFGIVERSFEIFPFFPGASLSVDSPAESERAPEDGDELDSPVTVPNYEGEATHDGSCLSDHAAVVADIGLVRLREDPVMNPFRDYVFDFDVRKVETNSGDCFLCGDPDMFGSLSHTDGSTSKPAEEFGPVDDSKVIKEPAKVSWCQPALVTNPNPAVQTLQLDVDELDNNKNDTFDVSPVSGEDEEGEDHVFYRYEDGKKLFLTDKDGTVIMEAEPQCDFATGGPLCSWDEEGDSHDSETAKVAYELSYEEVESCAGVVIE